MSHSYNSISKRTLVLLIAFVLFSTISGRVCWATENSRAILKVIRLNMWGGRAQDAYIYLDGQKIGAISNGDTVEFSIPAKKDKQTLVINEFFGYVVSTRQVMVSPSDFIVLMFYCCGDNNSNNGWVITRLDNEINSNQVTANNQNQTNIIELKLDKKLKSKIIKESPAYNIPKGQEKVVEDSIKLVHTITTTNESSLDNTLNINWGFIEAGIKNEVQKTISKSDAVESEIKRSIKIIGDGQSVKVVWMELYRTGTAKVEINGKISAIPFEYKEDFDLVLESITK